MRYCPVIADMAPSQPLNACHVCIICHVISATSAITRRQKAANCPFLVREALPRHQATLAHWPLAVRRWFAVEATSCPRQQRTACVRYSTERNSKTPLFYLTHFSYFFSILQPSLSLSLYLSISLFFLLHFFTSSSILLQFFFISSSSCYCIIVLHFGCADLRLKGWFYWSKLEGFLLTNL